MREFVRSLTPLALVALCGLSACATKVPDRIGASAKTPTEHFQARAEPASPATGRTRAAA